ncbi:MAG: hypothetical protein QF442_03150 [Candidatus Peribacteraceae bacterium]|nr:hypothetical protein [Candidatus Peribacteraceae bacterium]
MGDFIMSSQITELLEEILGNPEKNPQMELPQYVISGSGWDWFFDPESCQMVRTARGTEVVPMPGDPDASNRILVRAPFRFLMIPDAELEEVGWN